MSDLCVTLNSDKIVRMVAGSVPDAGIQVGRNICDYIYQDDRTDFERVLDTAKFSIMKTPLTLRMKDEDKYSKTSCSVHWSNRDQVYSCVFHKLPH